MALKMNKSKKNSNQKSIVCSKRWRGEDGEIKKYSATHASNSYTMVTRNFVPFTYKHSSVRRALWQKVRKHCSVTVGGGLGDKGGGLMSLLTNWEIGANSNSTKRIGKINWIVDWPLMTFCRSSRSHNRLEKTSKFHTFETRAWVHSSEVSLTLSIGFPPNRSSSPWSRLNSHIEKTGKILRKVFLKRRFTSRTHGGWENSCGGWNMLTL